MIELFGLYAGADPIYFFQKISLVYDNYIKENIVFFPPFDVRSD